MTPNDYEMIYVREMQEFLATSKMVAVFQAQGVRFKWKWHRAWQNARRCVKQLRDRFCCDLTLGCPRLIRIHGLCFFFFFFSLFFRAGMELRKYEEVMIRAAAAGTKYEAAIAHFLDTTTMRGLHHFVFSPEVQPKKMLDLDRKLPDFLLLGGSEGKLGSKFQGLHGQWLHFLYRSF